MNDIALRCRRHDDFTALAPVWDALAARRGSLFTGWHWLSNWWIEWGAGLELRLLSFETDMGEVVGIAPLYMRRAYAKGWLSFRQLQLVGNIYPTGETVLSEYGDIVVAEGYEREVKNALAEQLRELSWDELIIPLTTRDSFLFDFFSRTEHGGVPFSVDVQASGKGVVVDVTGCFDHYLSTLGKNTRLKLINRRSLLATLGAVEVQYAVESDIESFLLRLNALDRLRWGRECFGSKSMAFHRRVAEGYARRGALKLSALLVDGRVVSVLYNICHGDTEYNIQSAYDPGFHPKISLGTLHLGFALERAFADPVIHRFDLLFGEGKNEFYKQHYRGQETEFYTLVVYRGVKAVLFNRARQVWRLLHHCSGGWWAGVDRI